MFWGRNRTALEILSPSVSNYLQASSYWLSATYSKNDLSFS